MMLTAPDVSRPRLTRALGRFPQQFCLCIKQEVGRLAAPKRAFLQKSGRYLNPTGTLILFCYVTGGGNQRALATKIVPLLSDAQVNQGHHIQTGHHQSVMARLFPALGYANPE